MFDIDDLIEDDIEALADEERHGEWDEGWWEESGAWEAGEGGDGGEASDGEDEAQCAAAAPAAVGEKRPRGRRWGEGGPGRRRRPQTLARWEPSARARMLRTLLRYEPPDTG